MPRKVKAAVIASPAPVPTQARPSLPGDAKYAGELGHSGSGAFGTMYDLTEENSQFQFPQSLTLFAKMSRTPMIAGILTILSQAILADNWSVEPAEGDTSTAGKLCAKALEENLRAGLEWQGQTRKHTQNFDDVQRNYNLSLTYGFALDETVWEPNGLKARIAKLAPRLPQSVSRFETAPQNSADLLYIHQNFFNCKPMPSDKVTVVSLGKVGDNFQGQSPLRPLWQAYIVKDTVLRVTGQMMERNGMGIPTISAQDINTPKLDPTCEAELDDAVKDWRAGSNAGLRLPPGYELTIKGVDGNLPDTLPFLEYLDRLTAIGVVLPILTAGIDGGGAYAQAQTQDALSLRAVASLKRQLEEYINAGFVYQYWDMNFRGLCPRPNFKYANRIDLSLQQVLELVSKLPGSLFSGTPEDEDYVRESFNWPAKKRLPDMGVNPGMIPPPQPMSPAPGEQGAPPVPTPGQPQPPKAMPQMKGASRTKAWGFKPSRAPRVTEEPVAFAEVYEVQEAATYGIGNDFQQLLDKMLQSAVDDTVTGKKVKPFEVPEAVVEKIAQKLLNVAEYGETSTRREIERRR